MGSIGNTAALVGPKAQPTPEATQPITKNLVTFHSTDVGPPSQVYIGLNDQLQVTLYQGSSLSGGFTNLILDLRYLLPDGQLQIQEESMPVSGQGNPTLFSFKMAESFLLSVTARIPLNTPTRGQVFILLSLIRVISPTQNLTLTLARGYVSQASPVCWPAIPGDNPASRPGSLLLQGLGNPAAGADWSITVPINVRWRLMAAHATLTTAVAVANRGVGLVFGLTPAFIFNAMAQAVQAASLVWAYSWGSGVTSYTTAAGPVTPNMITAYPADLWLSPGQKIASATQNIQAADQWSNIVLMFEESIDM